MHPLLAAILATGDKTSNPAKTMLFTPGTDRISPADGPAMT
jgi:hypothetical protein